MAPLPGQPSRQWKKPHKDLHKQKNLQARPAPPRTIKTVQKQGKPCKKQTSQKSLSTHRTQAKQAAQ